MMVGIFFFSPLTGSNLKEKKEKLKWYIEARNIRGDVYDMRMGNIPLGPQSQVHIDHFISIGDSCNTPLPSSGFSFSRCLEESKVLADFVAKYLNDKVAIKDYRKAILGEKIPGIEIHLILSDMLSKFTDPMLNKSIGAMNKLNEDFLISFLTGRDMSINFAVTALRAIFNTFSLSEIRSLSLKQNYLKNLVNLYDILLSLPQANIREQIVDFVKGIIKPRLCNSHLLRLENPCCNTRFTIFTRLRWVVPRQIYEYACGPKSLQLRISQWFSAPRYGVYCTIWV
jgi:hypothetical protein